MYRRKNLFTWEFFKFCAILQGYFSQEDHIETVILVVVITLAVLGVGAYFFLMAYFPEWVGITGDVAQKNLREHTEGSESSDPQVFEDLKR